MPCGNSGVTAKRPLYWSRSPEAGNIVVILQVTAEREFCTDGGTVLRRGQVLRDAGMVGQRPGGERGAGCDAAQLVTGLDAPDRAGGVGRIGKPVGAVDRIAIDRPAEDRRMTPAGGLFGVGGAGAARLRRVTRLSPSSARRQTGLT